MHSRKSIVWLGIGTIITLAISFSCSKSKGSEKISQGFVPEAQAKEVPEAQAPKAVREVPPDIAKLNGIQAEIAQLSDEDIIKEETKFNEILKANNLIDRLNANQVNESERAFAKDILIRLALLRIEKSKRSTKAKK